MDAALSGPNGRVSLGNTILKIGRLPDNQLVVNDAKASSRHAEIRPEVDQYIVVDLGSTNGTFVNEQRLIPHTPRNLNSGDVIRIGDTSYTYEAASQQGYAPTVFVSSQEPGYAPTVAAPADYIPPLPQPVAQPQQDYAEYQAFSPVYAPPPQPQGGPPPFPQQGPPPFPQNYVPQPGYPPAQPGYAPPQPGYQQLPGAPAQKKSRKGLWITLSVIAAVFVLACGACGTLLYVNRSTPAKTLDAFCQDISNKDGADAFNQFSDTVKSQGQNSEATFVQLVDSGKITGCVHTAPSTSGESATAQITFALVTGSTLTENAHLAPDTNGAWKISYLQPVQP